MCLAGLWEEAAIPVFIKSVQLILRFGEVLGGSKKTRVYQKSSVELCAIL
jgi:hypothetical protein